MVWLGNAAHPRAGPRLRSEVCRARWGALPQRCLIAARLGSAALKIVGAPHIAPYMISIGPSFCSRRAHRCIQVLFWVGPVVVRGLGVAVGVEDEFADQAEPHWLSEVRFVWLRAGQAAVDLDGR